MKVHYVIMNFDWIIHNLSKKYLSIMIFGPVRIHPEN